ncbi:hypothetical protein [Methylobacterium gossipiicola]|uniref:Uncharacterized protein n=1 Tax=Methylobacterium gossipiicola TaxID=582675 RepID=A0A1I2T125_9HYPH|nr:hypothetical protein [Methylobacterium gossipiicola]SFG57849.1 hypothetical protein SAMN05192565_1065 [Methylobacterium gossipiicola]
MNEVIKCHFLGIGSVAPGDVRTNPSGREIWTGVRLRTDAGKTRFLKGALIEAEASLIINEAMDRGEQLEVWFSGKEERAYAYAIRSATEAWYYDGYADYLRLQGIKFLVIGVLTLPLLGLGIFFILQAFGFFGASTTFAASYPRSTFERGYEEGVLKPRAERALLWQMQRA